jgi:hypothetical protein
MSMHRYVDGISKGRWQANVYHALISETAYGSSPLAIPDQSASICSRFEGDVALAFIRCGFVFCRWGSPIRCPARYEPAVGHSALPELVQIVACCFIRCFRPGHFQSSLVAHCMNGSGKSDEFRHSGMPGFDAKQKPQRFERIIRLRPDVLSIAGTLLATAALNFVASGLFCWANKRPRFRFRKMRTNLAACRDAKSSRRSASSSRNLVSRTYPLNAILAILLAFCISRLLFVYRGNQWRITAIQAQLLLDNAGRG